MKRWPRITAFLLLLFANGARAQTPLRVIATKKELTESIASRPEARFVRLNQLIPSLVLDIRYATSNNFTKKVLYRHHVPYLRSPPAGALKEMQEELAKKGLGLKLFDAYRPYSVSMTMWQLTPDRHFVANPRRGSHHNRGTAVDVTIVDLRTGSELDMGTGYDNFTDSAHHDFANQPPAVIANRKMLKGLMWKHGFNFVPNEWWHYHWRDKSYDVVDLDFAAIE